MAQKRLPMRKARKILEFENIRRETRTRVIVLTDVGDNFFCVGGTHDEGEDTTLLSGAPRTLELCEAIERSQIPVIAAVTGFALGGGNVLQVVCGMTVAKKSAILRQVRQRAEGFSRAAFLPDGAAKPLDRNTGLPGTRDYDTVGARQNRILRVTK